MNSALTLTDFNPLLFSDNEMPKVSLYMRTHRFAPENRQDPTTFKNLLAKIESDLSDGFDKRSYMPITESLTSLLEDPNRSLWRHNKEGLAVLADQGATYVYHLDYPVDEMAVVSESFQIRPLIENFQYGAHYYLLAISSKSFDLCLGDFHSLTRLEMPEGVEREFSKVFDDFDNTSTINVGSFAGMDGRFYGRDSKSEVVQKETQKFFRYIDKAVMDHFVSEHRYPTVLVGLSQNISLFRSLSSIPTLLEREVEKSIDSLSETEVLAEASALIREAQEAEVASHVEDFGLAHAQGRAALDPQEIARALFERRVRTLFVEKGKIIPGHFDQAEGRAVIKGRDGSGSHDLADDFAQAAYLQGGAVYALDGATMPGDTGVAALFRY